ncbi:MAG: GntR family transcriptional regulator [Bryobacteraceae bacterium]
MAAIHKPPSPRGDRPIRERAYLLIQQKIARGDLPPGSNVSEVALAQELGSSRTPIREALGQLVAEGFLEQTPNRGAIVVQLKRQDIVDLYELREALEVYAVGKAARRASSPQEIKRLLELTNQIRVLETELRESNRTELSPKQMHRFVACDLGFHILLVRMAANARILKIVNETRLLIRIFAMHRKGHDLQALERIYRQHCEVLEAVAAHDSERGMRLLSNHIQASQLERLEEYDQWESEASLREDQPVFFDFHPATESL